MKKVLFLFLGLMSLATVSANNINKSTSKIGVTYRYNDAVTFYERGVEFHVFLNGDFDFNTHLNDTYYDYDGYRTKRGVRIDRDYNGRVRRIGNVFINYDYRGNVKRIGSVYMRYNRGALTRVGGLKIKYNRWGEPYFYGRVKRNDYFYDGYNNINIDLSFGDVCDYDDVYFYRPEFRRNYRLLREDDNFFYYRAQPNARIGKRSKVLKRRKATSSYYKNKRLKKKRTKVLDDDDGIYNSRRNQTNGRNPSRRSRQ